MTRCHLPQRGRLKGPLPEGAVAGRRLGESLSGGKTNVAA